MTETRPSGWCAARTIAAIAGAVLVALLIGICVTAVAEVIHGADAVLRLVTR